MAFHAPRGVTGVGRPEAVGRGVRGGCEIRGGCKRGRRHTTLQKQNESQGGLLLNGWMVDALLRDKMNRRVGLVNCYLPCSLPCSLPWQHGERQQGWYTSGTLGKQFPNLTTQFILSPSTN